MIARRAEEGSLPYVSRRVVNLADNSNPDSEGGLDLLDALACNLFLLLSRTLLKDFLISSDN